LVARIAVASFHDQSDGVFPVAGIKDTPDDGPDLAILRLMAIEPLHDARIDNRVADCRHLPGETVQREFNLPIVNGPVGFAKKILSCGIGASRLEVARLRYLGLSASLEQASDIVSQRRGGRVRRRRLLKYQTPIAMLAIPAPA
jgi:hypothetical protein